jgi:hypothetical protein
MSQHEEVGAGGPKMKGKKYFSDLFLKMQNKSKINSPLSKIYSSENYNTCHLGDFLVKFQAHHWFQLCSGLPQLPRMK